MENMITILLAGGKGTRLGETGRFMPKPLIHIGAEPVINYLIEKLRKIKKNKTIYILTRKEQPIDSAGSRNTLDLYTAFNKWKDVWYPSDDKIVLTFEEDLPSLRDVNTGAIASLYRFQQALARDNIDYGSVLVIAADNYIEDDLTGLLDQAKIYSKAIFNAYFDFSDKEKIRKKYGSLDIDSEGWVTEYEEKPENPSIDQTKASAAVYLFPKEIFNRLSEYASLKGANGNEMDAPGNFLKWFVNDVYPYNNYDSQETRQKGEGVRGYPLKGEWFDIGQKSDLIAAIKFYVDQKLTVMNTVEDLLLAEQTDTLNDKYYLLCQRIAIYTDEARIRLDFKSNGPICKLENGHRGNVCTVAEVKEMSKSAPYWESLLETLEKRNSQFSYNNKRLKQPFLISGGVFLFDSAGAAIHNNCTKLPASRTVIPFLEKDPASQTDAGRLTTPAGRLDMLDLHQVCYSELCEEMIFYGVPFDNAQTRLFAVAPLMMKGIKGNILRRLIDKNLSIPGINRDRIMAESRLPDSKISLVEIIPPIDIQLPQEKKWTVEIYLEGIIKSKCENVIVIPDRPNCTLEFRLACYADITGTTSASLPPRNIFAMQVGRLLGIADGDGFSRRPYLLNAKELSQYYSKMNSLEKKQILDYFMNSQRDAVNIFAVGAPGTGRFESFNSHMPVLPLTTSVRYLVELLSSLL